MPGIEAALSQTPQRPAAATRLKPSHSGLLVPCIGRRIPGRIDAIVVPTNRNVRQLVAAEDLAASLGCPLLVLCSGASDASQAAAGMGPASGVAVSVSGDVLHRLIALRTAEWLPERHRTYSDVATKRNVGLLLARMMGWERVLFLDDDIRQLDALQAAQAAAHVGGSALRVASWAARQFPDNSVACHALRASEELQDVFIGSQALLVYLSGWLPFFPAVYNEDWLFLFDFVVRGQTGLAGDVRQVPFDPFVNPERAHREEFGDVLAEGLFALIHERRSVTVGCFPKYWDDVLLERSAMLLGIEERLQRFQVEGRQCSWDGHKISKVLTSVRESRRALDAITATSLAEFTAAWRHDLYVWNARLPGLPRFSRLGDALNWLNLTDIHFAGAV
jgi:hypothetical protein